jgi:hypothetical protein
MDIEIKQLVGGVAAFALLIVIPAWCAWACAKGLLRMIQSETAVNRMLSVVHRHDDPGLYYLQLIGYFLLMVISGGISIYVILAFVQSFAGVE